MNRERSIVAVSCLLAALFTPAMGQEKNDGTTLTVVGQKTPEFEFTTLDGKALKSEDLQGKVVYLHFFATWCGGCLKELPHVETEVWRAFKDDANFAMVAVGREHTKEDLVTFRGENDYTFPYAPDPGRKMYSRFASRWIPRHYVIDTEGTIVFQRIGEEDDEREAMIEAIRMRLNDLKKKS